MVGCQDCRKNAGGAMKDVPYFPMYAANIIAGRPYKLMSLPERGLWITIVLECWVNGGVPSNFKEMSKILGFSEEDLRKFFSSHLTSFFHIENGQYISKELEEYRQGFLEKREKQRLGGKKGAENKKAKYKTAPIEAKGQPHGQPASQPKGSLSYINSASIKSNSLKLNQLTNKEISDEDFESWMNGDADSAEDYLRASGR